MQCLVECVKCCTDKAVSAINCVGIPASGALIVSKSYELSFTKDISWGYTVMPAAALVIGNIAYFTCCRVIKKKAKPKPFSDDKPMELP